MIVRTRNGSTFDTERDLTAPERHVLQKLFLWETMSVSLEQFREKRREALQKGWNGSGPLKEGPALKAILAEIERRVSDRLASNRV